MKTLFQGFRYRFFAFRSCPLLIGIFAIVTLIERPVLPAPVGHEPINLRRYESTGMRQFLLQYLTNKNPAENRFLAQMNDQTLLRLFLRRLDAAPQKSLFITDIDDTLLQSEYIFTSLRYRRLKLEQRKKSLWSEFPDITPLEMASKLDQEFWDLAKAHPESIPVDPLFSEVLEQARKRGHLVLALTARPLQMFETTVRQLRRHTLKFTPLRSFEVGVPSGQIQKLMSHQSMADSDPIEHGIEYGTVHETVSFASPESVRPDEESLAPEQAMARLSEGLIFSPRDLRDGHSTKGEIMKQLIERMQSALYGDPKVQASDIQESGVQKSNAQGYGVQASGATRSEFINIFYFDDSERELAAVREGLSQVRNQHFKLNLIKSNTAEASLQNSGFMDYLLEIGDLQQDRYLKTTLKTSNLDALKQISTKTKMSCQKTLTSPSARPNSEI